MNILLVKKKIESWLVDIEKRYEATKVAKDKELQKAIQDRRDANPGITFDQAAIDVLLQRTVVAETVVELAKDLWHHLDLK